MTSKADLRLAARARRAQLAADLPDYAGAIARHAADLPVSAQSIVASYWPLRDEADPRALAQMLVAMCHRIVLPCVAGADRALVFRRGDALRTNAFGIQEPPGDAPAFTPAVVLVPLLAFDAEGFRLGYGGGYYDRTLAALSPQPRAIGIGFALGRLGTIHPQPQDVPMDDIVTEEGVFRRVDGILQPA